MLKNSRDIEDGERVRVHRNLNNGKMSVLSWNKNHNDKGRVIAHVEDLNLEGCKMIVQPAGTKKAKETGERNVHAFIEGDIKKDPLEVDSFDGMLYYNPFDYNNFILKETGEKINFCQYINIRNGKYVYVKK